MNERWSEIRSIWNSNQILYGISGFLLGLLAFPLLQTVIDDLTDLLRDFVPEGVGIVFTVLFIDRLYQLRDRQSQLRELQQMLLRQLRSVSPATAMQALEEIHGRGWLEQGFLSHKDLRSINLPNAGLVFVNLQRSNLKDANFKETNLSFAQMQHVVLHNTNLQNARLHYADLNHADCKVSNLEDADLRNTQLIDATLYFCELQKAQLQEANLRGGDLSGSNLCGANFTNANLAATAFKHERFGPATLDKNTVLPDGSHYDPELGLEQLERFTNPEHPDFWQPEWVKTDYTSAEK